MHQAVWDHAQCPAVHQQDCREGGPHDGKDFMEAKAMGVELPRICPDCRGCQKCIFRGQQHTETETLQYKMIESGVKYNSLNDCFDVA